VHFCAHQPASSLGIPFILRHFFLRPETTPLPPCFGSGGGGGELDRRPRPCPTACSPARGPGCQTACGTASWTIPTSVTAPPAAADPVAPDIPPMSALQKCHRMSPLLYRCHCGLCGCRFHTTHTDKSSHRVPLFFFPSVTVKLSRGTPPLFRHCKSASPLDIGRAPVGRPGSHWGLPHGSFE